MAESSDTKQNPSRDGDRRGPDRRGNERRRDDRRTPAPAWRRPWAFVAYGVLGALAVVLVFRPGGGGGAAVEPGDGEVITAPAAHDVDRTPPPAAGEPPVEGTSTSEFERLLAEGEAAQGRRVNTRLFCGSMTPVALRSVPKVSSAVADLADATGRVPAVECKWGSATAAPDFLLIVPASLAEAFAAAPEVEQGFVRRRRVDAEIEWVGRSDALALRTAGVLREMR
ncbi:hypothetical protein BH23GEM6_BH23GEM6_19650 [soil metagenome]